MPLAKNIMGGGFSAVGADAMGGSVAAALVAAGTTQATALALNADVCLFGTVGASAGAILYAGLSGDSQELYNGNTGNTLLVYPPVGSRINNAAVNGAVNLPVNTYCMYKTVSATQIIANLSA